MISRTRDLEGNRLILASGYFSEYEHDKYSICADELRDSISTNQNIHEIDIIGGKGSKKSFDTFCEKIKSLGRKPFIPIRMSKNNWHAKIAMILKSDNGSERGIIPVCAIVGSSNLTRPAFGISPPPEGVPSEVRFNYECDVLIFSNEYFSTISDISRLETIFPHINELKEGSIYFPKIDEKYSLSELKQLKALFNLIKNSSEECKKKL